MRNSVFFSSGSRYVNFAMLLLRISICGSMLWFHGYDKISHPDKWIHLGESMHMFGIYFAPVVWGFLSAFAESFCAFFLAIGLFSRISALLLSINMFVALYANIHRSGDMYGALDLLCVFVFFLIAGPGKYSVDAKIK